MFIKMVLIDFILVLTEPAYFTVRKNYNFKKNVDCLTYFLAQLSLPARQPDYV